MNRQHGLAIGVTVAVLASSAAAGYMMYVRANGGCVTCKQKAQYQPAPDVSPEGNQAIAHMFEVITSKPTIAQEDADYLKTQAFSTEETSVRKWALATMSDRLVRAKMPDAIRADLEQSLIKALADSDSKVRQTAVVTVKEAKLQDRPGVREALAQLEQDPDPQVALFARRALER